MTLSGVLHRPAKRQKMAPAVLFLHGFTGNRMEFRRSFVRMARTLAAKGMASLRFDFAGSGDSEGSFADMTPDGELADAHAALRFLRRQPGIDRSRVALLGMSFGGMVAASLLGEDAHIRTAVLWSPVALPRDSVARKLPPRGWKLLKAQGYLDHHGWTLGPEFFKKSLRFDPLKRAARARCPVLLIHGDQDQSVPVSAAVEYQRAFRKSGQKFHLHLVQGAGHTYESIPMEKELFAVTEAWFEKYLWDGSGRVVG